jgi:hypothetical protein
MFTGAAPAGEETLADLKKIYPKWVIGQGYGKNTRRRPQVLLTISQE